MAANGKMLLFSILLEIVVAGEFVLWQLIKKCGCGALCVLHSGSLADMLFCVDNWGKHDLVQQATSYMYDAVFYGMG